MLERSYRRAAIVARRSGSNFYRSFALLPRDKRRAMTALYAFARYTDDLGDTASGTPAECLRLLHAWRETTLRVLQGDTSAAIDVADEPAIPEAIRQAASDLLPALADAAERYAIPHEHLLDIIDGVIADQTHRGFDTFTDLEQYCYLVASAVGLACMSIWGHAPELPRQAAIDCGVAFQLTNILRDVREDATLGRIYLPRQCWTRRDLSEAHFRDPAPPPAMLDVLGEAAARARVRFAQGADVYPHLHADGRRMFSMMWHTYRILLERIEADPAAVFRRRVALTSRDRLRVAACHFAGPRRSAASSSVIERYE